MEPVYDEPSHHKCSYSLRMFEIEEIKNTHSMKPAAQLNISHHITRGDENLHQLLDCCQLPMES